jgi:hypothetical protein
MKRYTPPAPEVRCAANLCSKSEDGSLLAQSNHVGCSLPTDAPAWAERFVQMVLTSSLPPGWIRPVLTLREATQLTGHESTSAFYRWAKTWAPRACCSHGRYTRVALCRGLDKEATQTRPQRARRPLPANEPPLTKGK